MNNYQLSNNFNSFTTPKEEEFSLTENSYFPVSVENGHGFYLIPPTDSRFSTSIKVVETKEKLEVTPYDLYEDETDNIISLASIFSSEVNLNFEDTLGEKSNSYVFSQEEIELLNEIEFSPYENEELLISIIEVLEEHKYYTIWSNTEKKYIYVQFTPKECVNLIYKLSLKFRGALIIDSLSKITTSDFQTIMAAYNDYKNPKQIFKIFKNIISCFDDENESDENEWYY